MEWIKDFVFQNFFLLCVVAILFIAPFINYRKHSRHSTYTVLAIFCTFSLALFSTLENYYKYLANPDLTLMFSILGYTFRPLCIYLLILLNDDSLKGKYFLISFIPIIFNAVIYSLSFIPELKEYIVYFHVNDDGTLSFTGGFLRFTSHIISALYLLYLLYVSFNSFKFKRLVRGIITLSCSSLVIIAVIVESFFNPDGDIYLLNTVVAFSILIYYIYLDFERLELDEITGFYNSETYNSQIEDMNNIISGIILFKINLHNSISNPTKEKEDQDRISTIAKIIHKSINRHTIAFRTKNDCIVLVVFEQKKETFISMFNKIKERLSIVDSSVDMSCSYKSDGEDYHELLLNAEKTIALNKKVSKQHSIIPNN